MTKTERIFWRALREAFPDHHWRKQAPIGPYFADFLCHAEKLVIELDGGQHAESQPYDERRTHFIEAQGFRALRFWNNDVVSNTGGVLDRIAESLSRREREGAAQPRKGEGDRSPSPSQPAAGPLPLPMGEA